MAPLGYVRVAVIAAALVGSACGPNTEPRKLSFERMREQQRLNSYGASSFFTDRMAMRTPPAGTLSREAFLLGTAVATGTRGGEHVADVPVPITPELLRDGERYFRIYCGACHGDDGSGRSMVAANMRPTPPPSLLTDAVRADTPGRLFEIISQGRGRMPPYDWALPARDRWAVVAYLRTLQGPARQ
jgi:mono/diheme cytochrome c family protein